MHKVLECHTQMSRLQYNRLYRMYANFKQEDPPIHNLTTIRKIPEYVLFILSLGLNFCLLQPFNYKTLETHFNEALRKISWITFFKANNEASILSNFDRLIMNIKKVNNPLENFCP